MMETFDLAYPFKNEDGVVVDTLTLRRPTVGDLTLMENESGTHHRSRKLIQLVAELSPKDLDAMDVIDWERINDKVETFFQSGPEPSDGKPAAK